MTRVVCVAVRSPTPPLLFFGEILRGRSLFQTSLDSFKSTKTPNMKWTEHLLKFSSMDEPLRDLDKIFLSLKIGFKNVSIIFIPQKMNTGLSSFCYCFKQYFKNEHMKIIPFLNKHKARFKTKLKMNELYWYCSSKFTFIISFSGEMILYNRWLEF